MVNKEHFNSRLEELLNWDRPTKLEGIRFHNFASDAEMNPIPINQMPVVSKEEAKSSDGFHKILERIETEYGNIKGPNFTCTEDGETIFEQTMFVDDMKNHDYVHIWSGDKLSMLDIYNGDLVELFPKNYLDLSINSTESRDKLLETPMYRGSRKVASGMFKDQPKLGITVKHSSDGNLELTIGSQDKESSKFKIDHAFELKFEDVGQEIINKLNEDISFYKKITSVLSLFGDYQISSLSQVYNYLYQDIDKFPKRYSAIYEDFKNRTLNLTDAMSLFGELCLSKKRLNNLDECFREELNLEQETHSYFTTLFSDKDSKFLLDLDKGVIKWDENTDHTYKLRLAYDSKTSKLDQNIVPELSKISIGEVKEVEMNHHTDHYHPDNYVNISRAHSITYDTEREFVVTYDTKNRESAIINDLFSLVQFCSDKIKNT